MSNPGQPTIQRGDQGEVVRRAQRGLRRVPDHSVAVDGIFGAVTEAGVKDVQDGAGLEVDGIVGDDTWEVLPNGGPMPLLKVGSTHKAVTDLQEVLKNGSVEGDWPSPGEPDGEFGPATEAAVEGFQKWGDADVDGVVGDETWSVEMHAASATLESAVGLKWAED
ncbi:peptidoglycan-binding domain-containing protein [Brevibacterium marinum]|uniref:Peptidoglycan hydrolase-like protein with peptidoglycan-binding domain n=1 Tax=Brevibacterium marinum TaxID=418643 RepID=A0A846S4I6_9MICO|nr:peptidoglycan-binding protein [Brevibacterium marinum]NJC58675.1 peptidoglycan hydrolase-like protein with peptidoglycan-binding domain [Brevibacterium marinum]